VVKKENAVAIKMHWKVYQSLSAEYCDARKSSYFRLYPCKETTYLTWSETNFDSFRHLCFTLSLPGCRKPFSDYKVWVVQSNLVM
jgi:hypothetical protein